jgi:hypothetical protein
MYDIGLDNDNEDFYFEAEECLNEADDFLLEEE